MQLKRGRNAFCIFTKAQILKLFQKQLDRATFAILFLSLSVLISCTERIESAQFSSPPTDVDLVAVDAVEPTQSAQPLPTNLALKTVFPTELVDGYIPNPSMGWQNTTGDIPSTMQYARFNWDKMNPAENVYDWSLIEGLRQKARASNQQMHFRIRNAQPQPWGPGQVLPAWVIEKGAIIIDGSEGTEPLYSNCHFLAAHAQFVENFRKQYDGDPDIAYLDIGAYGHYGEWDTDQYNKTPGSLDWHARRRLADMYLGGNGTRPCQQADGTVVDVSYDYPGFQHTPLLMPYTPWRKDTLFYAVEKRADVGIRHDALGSDFHQDKYREEVGELVEASWQRVPIVFELSSQADSEEALASARAFAQEMHASIVHQNFDGQEEHIMALLEVIGYRLVLREMTYVSELMAEDPFIVSMVWENTNIAPPYQAYPLTVSLVDEQDNIVWEQTVETDVRSWFPKTTITLQQEFSFTEPIPSGFYDVRIAFVDPTTSQPTLNLAIEGRDDNGRYQIGQVQIKENKP